MIDANVLRQLGWSDELIKAVASEAEPLRATPGTEIEVPITVVHAASGSAIYSDVVINNTTKEFTVQVPADSEPPAQPSVARPKKKQISR